MSKLYGTGLNGSGQLGLGDSIDRDVLAQIGDGESWSAVAVSFGGQIGWNKVVLIGADARLQACRV
jgi:hypothetical protein